MSDVKAELFNVLCKACNSRAIIEFWAGGNGDTGYLTFVCPNCGVIEHIED